MVSSLCAPDALICPPPPNCLATWVVSMGPWLRIEILILPEALSRRIAAIRTVSMARSSLTNPSVSSSIAPEFVKSDWRRVV